MCLFKALLAIRVVLHIQNMFSSEHSCAASSSAIHQRAAREIKFVDVQWKEWNVYVIPLHSCKLICICSESINNGKYNFKQAYKSNSRWGTLQILVCCGFVFTPWLVRDPWQGEGNVSSKPVDLAASTPMTWLAFSVTSVVKALDALSKLWNWVETNTELI